MIVSAARIFPVSSPPLDRSSLRIERGTISCLGPTEELLERFPGEAHYDFADFVMIPGLVNGHTHLEYTLLSSLARPSEFISWIRRLVRSSRLRQAFWGDSHWEKSARLGAAKSLRAGITTVGDIVTFGGGLAAAARSGIRTRAFLEGVAVRSNESDAAVARLQAALGSPVFSLPTLTPGISPHSVYTLSPEALSGLARFARSRNLPLALHAGESRHERDLLRGAGPLAPHVDRFGLPFGDSYVGSLTSYLGGLGALGENTLLAHCTHLDSSELSAVGRAKASVATCPRSNLLLGCGLPDYRLWTEAKVRFVYGTDSLASVPSFDLFEEARAVRKIVGEAADTILRRLTLGGAEALGLQATTGSLDPGKAADIALLSLPPGSRSSEHIVSLGSAALVKAAMVGGRFLYREKRCGHYRTGSR